MCFLINSRESFPSGGHGLYTYILLYSMLAVESGISSTPRFIVLATVGFYNTCVII